VSLVVGGIGLGIIGYHLLVRAAASARLAEVSDLAFLDGHDHEAWKTCARAKAAWGVDKADADGITRHMAEERDQENRRLRQEIERLQRGAPAGDEPAPAAPPEVKR
jgi:hypothetical protein